MNETIPCNLAVSGCGTLCNNNTLFQQSVYPKNCEYINPNKTIFLNEMGIELDNKNYTPVKTDYCKLGFAGNNQLLIDQARAQKLILDRPNFIGTLPVGDVPHDQIYTRNIDKYGHDYLNYNTIKGGNVQYYISTDLSQPYFKPNFTIPAVIDSVDKIDPMGNIKPQYNRKQMTEYMWNRCNEDQCDSSTHDMLQFREDLMERQMRKMNQNRYQNKFYNY